MFKILEFFANITFSIRHPEIRYTIKRKLFFTLILLCFWFIINEIPIYHTYIVEKLQKNKEKSIFSDDKQSPVILVNKIIMFANIIIQIAIQFELIQFKNKSQTHYLKRKLKNFLVMFLSIFYTYSHKKKLLTGELYPYKVLAPELLSTNIIIHISLYIGCFMGLLFDNAMESYGHGSSHGYFIIWDFSKSLIDYIQQIFTNKYFEEWHFLRFNPILIHSWLVLVLTFAINFLLEEKEITLSHMRVSNINTNHGFNCYYGKTAPLLSLRYFKSILHEIFSFLKSRGLGYPLILEEYFIEKASHQSIYKLVFIERKIILTIIEVLCSFIVNGLWRLLWIYKVGFNSPQETAKNFIKNGYYLKNCRNDQESTIEELKKVIDPLVTRTIILESVFLSIGNILPLPIAKLQTWLLALDGVEELLQGILREPLSDDLKYFFKLFKAEKAYLV